MGLRVRVFKGGEEGKGGMKERRGVKRRKRKRR
jgi:hypothetical protein